MLRWHWTPGAGGLLALVPASVVDATLGRGLVVPDGAAAVHPLHLTCLSSRSMAPLVAWLDTAVLAELPPLRMPALMPQVQVAERGPHPHKDPPGTTRVRQTGFLAATVQGQQACHTVLAEVVQVLDAESRKRGGPSYAHPEPQRFFHLSVWNNRGGDAMRSIGDIGPHDLRPPSVAGGL